jgi:hypothetical protein
MFDNNGRLAGFQMVVDRTTFPLYPMSNLRRPYFHDMDFLGDINKTAVSIYLTDPSNLCTAKAGQDSSSIGDRVWIRQGLSSNAQIDFEVIPLREETLVGGMPDNGIVRGGCAGAGFAGPGTAGMGMHYWRYLTPDQECMNAGPVFILYANGHISALGFTFVSDEGRVPTDFGIRPSLTPQGLHVSRPPCLWEFAHQPLYPIFFPSKELDPKCLDNLNRFNETIQGGMITTGTMHVFLTDPFKIQCPAPPTPTPTATPAPTTTTPTPSYVPRMVVDVSLNVTYFTFSQNDLVVIRTAVARELFISASSIGGSVRRNNTVPVRVTVIVSLFVNDTSVKATNTDIQSAVFALRSTTLEQYSVMGAAIVQEAPPTEVPTPQSPTDNDQGLTPMAIVGIVIGVICVLLLIGAAYIMMQGPSKASSNDDFGHDFHELRNTA